MGGAKGVQQGFDLDTSSAHLSWVTWWGACYIGRWHPEKSLCSSDVLSSPHVRHMFASTLFFILVFFFWRFCNITCGVLSCCLSFKLSKISRFFRHSNPLIHFIKTQPSNPANFSTSTHNLYSFVFPLFPFFFSFLLFFISFPTPLVNCKLFAAFITQPRY